VENNKQGHHCLLTHSPRKTTAALELKSQRGFTFYVSNEWPTCSSCSSTPKKKVLKKVQVGSPTRISNRINRNILEWKAEGCGGPYGLY